MLVGLLLMMVLMGEPVAAADASAETNPATNSATNSGATTQPRAVDAAAASKPDEPKKICVLQAQTGSHFKKRICATAEEWEERRRRDAEAIAKMNDRQGFCRGDNC